jgi:ribonuclease BN (tRNA processing enzyme)
MIVTLSLIELASGADAFLCEASWTDSPERPKHLHLSGAEAGQVARKAVVGRLLLTHILPGGHHQRGQGRVRRPGACGGARRGDRDFASGVVV